MKTKILVAVAVVLLLVALGGVSRMLNKQMHPELYLPAEPPKAPPPKETVTPLPKESPAYCEPVEIATVNTTRGVFRIALYERDVPVTTKNFTALVKKGFYNGLRFHRVEDWVVQGGDPKGDGTGGSGKTIALETKEGLDFTKPYAVGMARSEDPNSATSQFFVTKDAARQLNGQYAMFGRVFDGEEVIDRVQKGDKIVSITLAKPTGADFARVLKIERPVEDPRDKEKPESGL